MKIGVLASYEGTTLQAIIDACATGEFPAQVAVVISNNRDSGALRRAGDAGIAAWHLSGQTHPNPVALDDAIRRALVTHGVDLVVLAGYMKKIGPRTLGAFSVEWESPSGAVLPSRMPRDGNRDLFHEVKRTIIPVDRSRDRRLCNVMHTWSTRGADDVLLKRGLSESAETRRCARRTSASLS